MKFKTQLEEFFVPSTRHQNCLDKSLIYIYIYTHTHTHTHNKYPLFWSNTKQDFQSSNVYIFKVLADGTILDCLSTLKKDNTG